MAVSLSSWRTPGAGLDLLLDGFRRVPAGPRARGALGAAHGACGAACSGELTRVAHVHRAERDQAVARYDFIINTLRLRAAAGSLSHADLLAINSALR